ncbi:hypothetical protein V9T40_001101 [Parthenolecanium corni]|uniref:CRAL-TRIO domain-containing protein n=1 Tax=Parthenolecanium corni TaxID=536013 RepID=A0AAN9TAS2_9HEMI
MNNRERYSTTKKPIAKTELMQRSYEQSVNRQQRNLESTAHADNYKYPPATNIHQMSHYGTNPNLNKDLDSNPVNLQLIPANTLSINLQSQIFNLLTSQKPGTQVFIPFKIGVIKAKAIADSGKEYTVVKSRICKGLITYIPTPQPTADGYRVVVFRIFEQAESTPSQENFMKALDFQLDYGVWNDMNRGTIFIYDYENLTMNSTLLFFSATKRALEIGLNSKPMRTKKIYLLNLSPLAEPLVRFCKSLVKKEFSDRVEIWKNPVTELADVLPKSSLPSDYGGSDKSVKELRDNWYRVLVENSDWFKSEETVKADLSKKVNPDSCKDTMPFGIEGSFRKITID